MEHSFLDRQGFFTVRLLYAIVKFSNFSLPDPIITETRVVLLHTKLLNQTMSQVIISQATLILYFSKYHDILGGSAVQYREAQGSESPQFKAIFKANPGGIEYLPGGVASGFKKVVLDVYSPRLLHLKGKTTVTVTEVTKYLCSDHPLHKFLIVLY